MNWPFARNYKEICSQSENGDTGFYPFGAGNLWHSGIHIQADKDVIEPVVNGQLVSYRLGSEKHGGTLPQKVTSTYYETLMADYRELYKKEMISIEKTGTYLISSGSSYKKIEEKTNGTETCSKIELKSFNAFYKIENKEVWWVTPHNYYQEHIDFRQNSLLKDSLKYLQDILTAGNFTEKYRLKTTDHRDTNRAEIPFSELDNIKNPVFWLNEAGSRDFPAKAGEVGKCATGKNYDEYEVFPECPFKYEFEECGEDVDAANFEINEDAVYWGTIGKGGENANFRRIDGTEYFVRDSDVRKCPAFDWEEWFTNMTKKKAGRSDGIICDKNELIRNINCGDELNTLFGDAKKYYPQNFYRVFGGYGDDDSSKRAVMKTRAETRKMVCKHPLEFDKSLFPESKKDCKKFSRKYRKSSRGTAVISPTTAGCLRVEASNFDLWENALDQIFGKENSFFFLHPAYSLRHFERAGLFEFNPYEGMKYSDIYSGISMPIIVGNNITESGDSVVVDSPGFAPVWAERNVRNPNINGYACVTGFFNQNYLNVRTGSGETYKEKGYSAFTHEGVDFRGSVGTEIKSFIYGEVLAYGTFGSYGRVIFIANKDKTGIFLLGHLSRYNTDVLDKKAISPGDVVGYVGTSGPSDKNGIDGKYDAHLHISYFKPNKKDVVDDFVEWTTGSQIVQKTKYSLVTTRNPFNHESKKTANKK